VQAIDLDGGTVRLDDATQLGYDRLLISLGGTTGYNGVPGAREHTLPLRTYREAQALQAHLVAQYQQARALDDPKERRRALTVVVVGGGYTGIQLAGELGVYLPELATRLGLDPGDVRVALLDRNEALLPQMGTWANDEAERALNAQGVALYLRTSVEAVEPGALLLDGKRRLRAGTMVWAGGVVAPALLADAGLPTAAGGRVVVDRWLRADQRVGRIVYAAGDCALVRDGAGQVVPGNASYALRQGEYLARQVAAELQGEPPQPYAPLKLGEVVSLGPGRAVGNPFGVAVNGLPAVLLKRGIEAWYLATLEPDGVGPII
jgi:NADH:ubiquinone reductase (H+-translocating)